MKVVAFGTVFLACAIPAFAQVETTIPGNCQAAIVNSGVPSAVVIMAGPMPLAAGRGPGFAQRPGIPSSQAPVHAGIVIQPSPSPFGIGSSAWTGSGIGAIGIGGIGSIGTGGIGSIGMGGIGTIGAPGLAVVITPPPLPFTTPLPPLTSSPAAGSYSRTIAVHLPLGSVADPLPT
jgi:hypothetical protein